MFTEFKEADGSKYSGTRWFPYINEAIVKIEESFTAALQPMRRETKETVKNFNKKCRKDERKIHELTEDQQYSQR